MNFVDLLLGVVILLSVWAGWRRGLLLAGTDLLVLAGSLMWAFWAYAPGARLAGRYGVQAGVWALPVAFLVAYMLGRIVLGLLFGRLVGRAPPPMHAHPINRALGAVPGTVNGLLNALVVAILLLALPLSDQITRATSESLVVDRFAGPAQWLEARLAPIFNPAFEQTLGKLTVPPDSRASLKLPFTVKNPQPRPDLEAAMLGLLNAERGAHGLRPLHGDPQAAEVARAHSRDMFARGYFSHVSPPGEDAAARMRRAKLGFLVAGENLALSRTLSMAHQGLMNSPGHRANILRPQFGRVGIGIVDGGRYGLMVTQAFRN
jgi:uncharacterized protein YkwD